ncbi:SseB family protein [Pararhodobacter sp. CCB-MM2]|uniref:SseB family protein n=1 Tax=Pararhodobacter sp. CCB-MM2 TaxID=1786003 RepID=UPI0008369526|nr:SseB family protein [Pararhodobacter sp. CCB-MM2]MCA2010344.1 SseB family protein [Cereibacter sphaeroides]
MTETTPTSDLDAAMIRLAAAPEDSRAEVDARLAFHAELSRAELFVLLETEVVGDAMQPRVFDLSDMRAVLAFDSELRLAGFAGEAAPYAALPGRVMVNMLAASGEGLALLVNADAEHAQLMSAEALEWLAATLAAPAPTEGQAVPEGFAPIDLPDSVRQPLVTALERRLSGMPGLETAVLAGVQWQGGARGHVLALAGLPDTAQPAIARAVSEALALSGLEGGALDVIFPPERAMKAIAAVGFALSPAPFAMPEDQVVSPGSNPGMDPARPPKLR